MVVKPFLRRVCLFISLFHSLAVKELQYRIPDGHFNNRMSEAHCRQEGNVPVNGNLKKMKMSRRSDGRRSGCDCDAKWIVSIRRD